jgi:hypothetical protein
MENRVEISLAKALKIKNRLAGRVAALSQDIKTYNSRQEGAEVIDVQRRYADRAELVARLVDLKTAINQANQPVQRAIYTLAERKALLALLGELNTHHGAVSQYHQAPISFVAQLRKEQVDQERLRLEREVDALQEQLDRFNQLTTIVVDADLLGEGVEAPNVR